MNRKARKLLDRLKAEMGYITHQTDNCCIDCGRKEKIYWLGGGTALVCRFGGFFTEDTSSCKHFKPVETVEEDEIR